MMVEAGADPVRWSGVPVSVVIPARNAAAHLPALLPLIPERIHEVILVDDASTDDTVAVARRLRPDVRVIETGAAPAPPAAPDGPEPPPAGGQGKAASLQTGFAAATGEIIVTFDADGSADPREIPRFVGHLLAGADYAKGSRFLQGGVPAPMPWHWQARNAAFVGLVRLLFGGRFSDLGYGYNAFWRRTLPALRLDGDGPEIEAIMNIRALQVGLKVVEVPSAEAPPRRPAGDPPAPARLPHGWGLLKTIWRERREAAG
jgi:glycosyltransferase involved in cell wall biosynthesis